MSKTRFGKFWNLTPGDPNFDLSQKMTAMISKWFFASFERCLSFFSTATRSRDHGGVQTPPPPPSRRWKIQRPSRARVKRSARSLSPDTFLAPSLKIGATPPFLLKHFRKDHLRFGFVLKSSVRSRRYFIYAPLASRQVFKNSSFFGEISLCLLLPVSSESSVGGLLVLGSGSELLAEPRRVTASQCYHWHVVGDRRLQQRVEVVHGPVHRQVSQQSPGNGT